MCAIRRRAESASPSSRTGSSGPDVLISTCPTLWEFLTTAVYEDGKPRQLPTVMLFYDAPLVKACLNDRDQGLSCWVSAETWMEAMEALERGLAGDCLEWRRPSGPGKKKR